MTLTNKINIGLLAAAALLFGWQIRQHLRLNDELGRVEAQSQTMGKKIESQRVALAKVEKQNNEVEAAERRAGNQTLISLMKERNVATMSMTRTPSQKHIVRNAFGGAMDNTEQQQVEREYLRNRDRAANSQAFKLLNIPIEKQDQYIDFQVGLEQRNNARLAALLQGKMSVADALQERDNDIRENEKQRREILGDAAAKWFDEVADGMRRDEAKRLVNDIQSNMGDNRLNEEQSSRLQNLLKAEIAVVHLDDTDLFRPPEEWTQIVREHQNVVLRQATEFLNAAQIEKLKKLAAADLEQMASEAMKKRKSLGIH